MCMEVIPHGKSVHMHTEKNTSQADQKCEWIKNLCIRILLYMPVTILREQIEFPTDRLGVNKQETTIK